MTVITNSIQRRFYEIPTSYKQIFGHPDFSLTKSSQAEIVRERAQGDIPDSMAKVVKFLLKARFATADQIARFVGSEVDNKFMDNAYRNLFVNRFVMSDLDTPDAINEKDALYIYTLDFGGSYLLSYEGVDTTSWRYSEAFASATLVAKGLQQVEILLGLYGKTHSRLREYSQFKEFRVGEQLVKTDFEASLQVQDGNVINFLGYLVEPGFEDLNFRDQIDVLNSVFKQTQAWKRYYPLGESTLPKLLIVVRDASVAENIKRVANVIAASSDYEQADVMITGYDQISQLGLAKAQFFTFAKGEKDVRIGKMNVDVF